MNRARRWTSAALLAVLLTSAAGPVMARGAATRDPVVETGWGVAAAAACGLGVRYFPLIVEAGVGGVAGLVAVCLFAAFDAWTTADGAH
jgi:hypothetical protein